MMNERDVKRRLVDDRHRGFVALVRWSSDPMYRGLLRLVRDRQLAEDLSQETFLRAWKALGTYPDERILEMRLQGWLWTIAINRARTHLAKPALPWIARDPQEDIAKAVSDADEADRLLGHLEEPVRTSVVLRHVVGLSYAEIAEALDRPTGTVKSDVHRAMKKLKEIGATS